MKATARQNGTPLEPVFDKMTGLWLTWLGSKEVKKQAYRRKGLLSRSAPGYAVRVILIDDK